jgi:acylphosphatase
MDDRARSARRVVVHGRVQGVGFRRAAEREALRLGVVGWVANRADGAVEAHLEGAAPAVAAAEAWFARGPLGARVDLVEASSVAPVGARAFEVRR